MHRPRFCNKVSETKVADGVVPRFANDCSRGQPETKDASCTEPVAGARVSSENLRGEFAD